MRTVPLDELAEIVSGATPKTGVPEYWDGDVPWVTPADLSSIAGTDCSSTSRCITQAGLRSCSTRILPAGSVLLSSRAPIGHVAINTVPMATNQGFKSLIPGPRLDARYLYFWLRSNKEYLQSLGNGATFKELSKSRLAAVEVPCPELDEQRRIAAILDQADALRARRRQQLAHLDALPHVLFDKLIAGVRAVQPLEFFASNHDNRRIPLKASDRATMRGAVPYYGASGIIDHVERPIFDGLHVLVSEDGANLFSRTQPIAFLAEGSFWVNNHAHVLRPHAGRSPHFLRLAIERTVTGGLITGSAQPKLTRSALDSLKLPVVPPAAEARFEAAVVQITRLQAMRGLADMKQQGLIQCLQARAFRGEL